MDKVSLQQTNSIPRDQFKSRRCHREREERNPRPVIMTSPPPVDQLRLALEGRRETEFSAAAAGMPEILRMRPPDLLLVGV